MVALGVPGESAQSRTLDVELEFQHTGGMLEPAELDQWLANPELAIEALYHPLKLIEGKTATRIRMMPIGSRLEPILHTVTLRGAQVERAGRALRFRLDERPPTREPYRLLSLYLRMPVPPGLGRPQPELKMLLLHEPPANGVHQVGLSGRYGTFDLGQRLRYRWSDAQGESKRQPQTCGGDVHEVDAERYRFRPRHRYAGLFEFLTSDVSSDPPAKPRAGWQSFQMRAPYPEPIAGWRVSRNHLIRLDVGKGRIDRMSIYAEQAGPGQCKRTRAYDALLAGDQFVRIERSLAEYDCDKEYRPSQIVRAEWLEDGSLARYMEGSGASPTLWDAFSAGQPAACGSTAPSPDATRVDALQAELQQLRNAFVAH
jgi:hypothetical protein